MTKFRISDRMGKFATNSMVRYKTKLCLELGLRFRVQLWMEVGMNEVLGCLTGHAEYP